MVLILNICTSIAKRLYITDLIILLLLLLSLTAISGRGTIQVLFATICSTLDERTSRWIVFRGRQ